MPILKGREPYNQVLNMASFWLMTGGMAFMTFTLTFAGHIQTHMQRVLGNYYMDVQDELALFYLMRFGAGVVVVLGALLFIYSMLVPRREVISARRPSQRNRPMDGAMTMEGRQRPLLPSGRATNAPCSRRPMPIGLPLLLKGPTGLRQDPLRRAYGGAARAGRSTPWPAMTTCRLPT